MGSGYQDLYFPQLVTVQTITVTVYCYCIVFSLSPYRTSYLSRIGSSAEECTLRTIEAVNMYILSMQSSSFKGPGGSQRLPVWRLWLFLVALRFSFICISRSWISQGSLGLASRGRTPCLLIIIPVRTADSMAVSANRKSQCKVVMKWQFVHELNLRDGFVCFVSPFLSLLYLSNLSYFSKAPFFYHPPFLPRRIIVVQNYHLLSPSFSLNAQTQL